MAQGSVYRKSEQRKTKERENSDKRKITLSKYRKGKKNCTTKEKQMRQVRNKIEKTLKTKAKLI